MKPKPFAVVYEALPEYPESDIAEAIAEVMRERKRSISLADLIETVRKLCQGQEDYDLHNLLRNAQDAGRGVVVPPKPQKAREPILERLRHIVERSKEHDEQVECLRRQWYRNMSRMKEFSLETRLPSADRWEE